MDQNSNMGGFAPMPGQAPGVGGNTAAMPNAAPAAAPAPGAPVNNSMPSMGTPVMPGMPAPGAAGTNFQTPAAGATAATTATAGKKDTTLIETIILVAVCVIAAAAIIFAVIFFMQWNSLKTNYDSEVAMKEAAARQEQSTIDEEKAKEEKNLPFSKFTGPSDYGSISFEYPKTWSVYVKSDGMNNSDYEAFFSPYQVDPVDAQTSRYALRFKIFNQQISSVQQQYDSKLQDGSLVSSVFNADDNKITGTKYEGTVAQDMQGIIVLFKVNDKTVMLQTDALSYKQDFETLISKIRRNS